MPALGSIFATKAGDKAGTGDRPGHMTSPAPDFLAYGVIVKFLKLQWRGVQTLLAFHTLRE